MESETRTTTKSDGDGVEKLGKNVKSKGKVSKRVSSKKSSSPVKKLTTSITPEKDKTVGAWSTQSPCQMEKPSLEIEDGEDGKVPSPSALLFPSPQVELLDQKDDKLSTDRVEPGPLKINGRKEGKEGTGRTSPLKLSLLDKRRRKRRSDLAQEDVSSHPSTPKSTLMRESFLCLFLKYKWKKKNIK
jgi:hypothetical protein